MEKGAESNMTDRKNFDFLVHGRVRALQNICLILWILLCFVCHGKFTILFVFFILFSKSQIKSHGLLSNTLMYYKRLWFYKYSKITKSHALRYHAFLSHLLNLLVWFFRMSKITLLITIPVSVILGFFKNHIKDFYKSLSYAVCKEWCDFVIFC